MEVSTGLVIKNHDPKRNRMIWLGVIAASLVAGIFIYLLGQAKGGYDARESKSEIKRLNAENESLDRSNQKLREQMAVLRIRAKNCDFINRFYHLKIMLKGYICLIQ